MNTIEYFKLIENEGQLNYFITKLCKIYVELQGETYATYNALIGVLESAKLELYRRRISLYENEKCIQNSDVWGDK